MPCQSLRWCLRQIDYYKIFFHESLAHQNSLFQVFMDTRCHSNFLNTTPHEMSHEKKKKYLSVSCLLSLNQIYTAKVCCNFTYATIKCVELQVRNFKTINTTIMYLLASIIVHNLQKIIGTDPKLLGRVIFGPINSHLSKIRLFRKNH